MRMGYGGIRICETKVMLSSIPSGKLCVPLFSPLLTAIELSQSHGEVLWSWCLHGGLAITVDFCGWARCWPSKLGSTTLAVPTSRQNVIHLHWEFPEYVYSKEINPVNHISHYIHYSIHLAI